MRTIAYKFEELSDDAKRKAVENLYDINVDFEEYLSLLRQEYEYLTSKDAIVETIQANDYEFTEEGKLV